MAEPTEGGVAVENRPEENTMAEPTEGGAAENRPEENNTMQNHVVTLRPQFDFPQLTRTFPNDSSVDAILSDDIAAVGQILDYLSGIIDQNQNRSGTDELRSLSRSLRCNYPDLVRYFEEWTLCRERLIRKSFDHADKIDTVYGTVSAFRIITSVTDTVYSFLSPQKTQYSWLNLTAEMSPVLSLASLFLQTKCSQGICSEIQNILKEDQEVFNHVKCWFEQAEELERVPAQLFNFGISQDLLRRINEVSDESNICLKLFRSIIASNVPRDPSLLQDEEFLVSAASFAMSDIGFLWFSRFILNPLWTQLKEEYREFQAILECLKSLISSTLTHDPEFVGVDAVNILNRKKIIKLGLNFVTVGLAINSIWTGNVVSKTLRDIGRSAEREVRCMETALHILHSTAQQHNSTQLRDPR